MSHINWVRHFVENHLDEMVAKSLCDRHARGVDSVMFDDTPGARIRLFVANENHELYTNSACNHRKPVSVAFHPHHCDTTLEVVKGNIINVKAMPCDRDAVRAASVSYNRFLYRSKIRDCEGGFTLESRAHRLSLDAHTLRTGATTFLAAPELHTIFVYESEEAAWFVHEGAADPAYQPFAYSDADLTQFDASGMYRSMERDYLLRLIARTFELPY